MGRHLISLIVAAAVSAALFYFGTGLHPAWWITWFAPLPVLLAAPQVSRRSALAAAVLAWAVGGLNMWRYEHDLLSMPVGICLAILLMPSLFFALAVLLFRWLVRRGAVWQFSMELGAKGEPCTSRSTASSW